MLLSPALAWLRDRRWAPGRQGTAARARPSPDRAAAGSRADRPRAHPGADDGWAAAGVDEFLRAFLTPRGRAAFYAAARNIYLDEPHGEDGFWTRLANLAPDTMFVWGRKDALVPISFMKHVERALPRARHVELDCGHVPQLERPAQTHAAMREFFAT